MVTLINIDFVQSIGWRHFLDRMSSKTTFPLTWTMSPNLLDFAPSMISWYYQNAGPNDYFMMPPSGTLYAYPGLMSNSVQSQFVARQNQQFAEMNTTTSIHWELMLTWKLAFDRYFPRYSNKAFFLNNVPWMLPDCHFAV